MLLVVLVGSSIEDNIEKELNNQSRTIPSVTIEGHEYFKLRQYLGFYTLTHKGNCRACCGNAEK